MLVTGSELGPRVALAGAAAARLSPRVRAATADSAAMVTFMALLSWPPRAYPVRRGPDQLRPAGLPYCPPKSTAGQTQTKVRFWSIWSKSPPTLLSTPSPPDHCHSIWQLAGAEANHTALV